MIEQTTYASDTQLPLSDIPIPESPNPKRGVTVIEILIELARNKWLVAKITGAALLAGVALSLILPIRYTAETKIMTPQQTPSAAMLMMDQMGGAGGAALSALAGGTLGFKDPNDIYIALLSSRPIAFAIIKKFDLEKIFKAKDLTAARENLANSTKIVSEKTGLISISVTDKDKKRAAEIANAYTEELQNLTQTLAVTTASQRRLFYEVQLKQANEALTAADVAFQQIQKKSGLVQLDAQARALIQGMAELRAQVAAKQVEVQTLRSYSTDRNPELQVAEKQLSSMQAEQAQLEQQGHSKGVDGLGLSSIPTAGQEYLRAQHELVYRQTLFDLLMKQYDAAKLDESKQDTVIQVVEPAIEPDRKSSPKRALIVIGFSAAGFFAGLFFVVFRLWKKLIKAEPLVSDQLKELKEALSLKAKAEW